MRSPSRSPAAGKVAAADLTGGSNCGINASCPMSTPGSSPSPTLQKLVSWLGARQEPIEGGGQPSPQVPVWSSAPKSGLATRCASAVDECAVSSSRRSGPSSPIPTSQHRRNSRWTAAVTTVSAFFIDRAGNPAERHVIFFSHYPRFTQGLFPGVVVGVLQQGQLVPVLPPRRPVALDQPLLNHAPPAPRAANGIVELSPFWQGIRNCEALTASAKPT